MRGAHVSLTSLQCQVATWMRRCFGTDPSVDTGDRAARFMEEALELAQAAGLSRDDAIALIAYVYDRPRGRVAEEVGDVLMTLCALATARNVALSEEGRAALQRCWENTDRIRAKNAARDPQSPLPGQI
jgi:NTP pyrophosphatase (non-canonical NTP hydrolase)